MRARAPGRRGSPGAAPLALLAALVLAAPTWAAGKTYRIPIAQMAFGRAPSGLRVGDTVEWVNQDILEHTATARNGGFDLDLPPHARGRTRLRRPGVVSYYCRFHPGMTGKLTVGR